MSRIQYEMLRSRDLQTDIQTLPDTLSSWDKCMAKDFCKWPLIAGCIIGGLIVISLLWCLIRCLMCGYACCSCCCGGCGGRRSKSQKHQVEFVPVQPPPVYQPPAYREEPQYAYSTDRNGNVSGDALPAMPTWESTKVEIKEEVEMGYVNNEGYKRKPPSPGHNGGYAPSPPMVAPHAPQQRGLTPAPPSAMDPYTQQNSHIPTQRVLSPGPMPAPIPVNPSGQKMGFNPRGPSPGPHQYEYEDRDPIQDNYGYRDPQQGPRWGNQPPQQRNPYDLPYDNDAPEVVLPPQLQPGGPKHNGGGANADYYNAYSAPEVLPQQTSGGGGVGGYAAYQPSRASPHAHGQAPPHSNGQSMYPVDDRVYDYDDPHRRKTDPWSAL